MARLFTILVVERRHRGTRSPHADTLREGAWRTDRKRRLRGAWHLAERPVDVLFADIVMAGIDGVRLARQAKLMRPGIKVLFATGYPQKATERNAMHVGGVLYKPLRAVEVVREVEALLAA